MPHRAFIGIGTNLGDRSANYREAIRRIDSLPGTRTVRQSSVYETEPVGDEIKCPFLNGVLEVETELAAEPLMKRLLGIERAMGRTRDAKPKRSHGRKYKPRVIDLDLLFFDNAVLGTKALELPHPRLHERRFVLAPMAELAPALVHPALNESISELLTALKDPHRVSLARAEILRRPWPKRDVMWQ